MPSPALTAYNDAVDATAIGAGAKTALKALGRRLYVDTIKEGAEHDRYHLTEYVASQPQSARLDETRDRLLAILDRVKNMNDALALNIAEALR